MIHFKEMIKVSLGGFPINRIINSLEILKLRKSIDTCGQAYNYAELLLSQERRWKGVMASGARPKHNICSFNSSTPSNPSTIKPAVTKFHYPMKTI
jgi:hypothetical protein